MSAASGCPVCGKPVDAVRSRFVRVVAGQVIAYCSNECKAQETEAVGNVLRTGRNSGAIAIAAVDASRVIPGIVSVPTVDADTAVTAPQAHPPVMEHSTDKPKQSHKAANATTVDTVKAADAVKVVEAGKPVDAVKAVEASRVGKAVEAGKAIESNPKSVASKASFSSTASKAEPASKSKPSTSSTEKKNTSASTEPLAAAAATINDIQSGAIDAARQRRNWIFAVVAAVVVIAALALWKIAGSPSAPESAPTKPGAPPVGSNAGAAAELRSDIATSGTDPSIEMASALVQSQVALNDMLKSKSLRLRRLAAAALARTSDAAAITTLAAVSAETESDLGKAEISYAMARGGDAKGREDLVERMNSTRRDAKADAARLLAQLGDPRATPVLKDFLDITQHALSAAEQLARSKDPAAMPVLEKIMAKPDLTSDEKSRVTIAMAVAGKTDVLADVEKMLTDQRFNHGAAVALARLGKSAAAKTLREQLSVSSLRVQAARSLRLLSLSDASVKIAEVLPGLLADLKADKDTARASAAEALLLLTGDAAWGAYE